MGAGIYEDNLDLVVSACSDASEDGEDQLQEEGVGWMVLPAVVHQGNVSLYKINGKNLSEMFFWFSSFSISFYMVRKMIISR